MLIAFPYNEFLLEKVRQIPGRVWSKSQKAWAIPLTKENLKDIPTMLRQWDKTVTVDPSLEEWAKGYQQREAQVLELKSNPKNVTLPDDTYFHTQPFEHQKLALALSLWNPAFGLFMEMGCVSGDTQVSIPGHKNQRIDSLARRGHPFPVWAVNARGEFIATWSAGAFLKGLAPLYQVTLESGRAVKCTQDHAFLTAQGWRRLCDVRVGHALAIGPAQSPGSHEPTISGCGRLAHAANDRGWSERHQDCPGDCSIYPRRYDERLPMASSSGLTFSPSQGDARARFSRALLHKDARATKLNDSHFYQSAPRLSMPDSRLHSWLYDRGAHNSECNPLPIGYDDLAESQFEWPSDRLVELSSRNCDQWVFVNGACKSPCTLKWDKVVSITHLGLYPFYDMHVPGYENYLANGIVHHNTGKTKVMIDLLGNLVRKRQKMGPALVICPVSVMENWKIEAEKHQPGLKAVVLSGTTARKTQQLGEAIYNGIHLVSVNYESAWRMEEALEAVPWDMMILDESTKIKHRATKQAKAIMRLGSISKRRYILTGSPMPNSPLELFNQVKFLDPTIFGTNWYAFRDRYAIMGGYGNYQVIGWKNLDELSTKLNAISYRVLKKDCLDLPEKIYKEYRMTMSDELKKTYKELAETLVTQIQGQQVAVNVVLAQLTKLRQLTGGWVYDGDKQVLQVKDKQKLNQLIEIVTDVSKRHKIVIWGTFRHELDIIEAACQEIVGKGAVVRLDGSVSQGARQDMVTRFQTDPTCKIFVGQQHAGGLGITLTAADYCIFFSNDYSPEFRFQCEDRLHRIGQKNQVVYVDLIMKGTIDTVIQRMLKRKQSLADQITNTSIAELVYGTDDI